VLALLLAALPPLLPLADVAREAIGADAAAGVADGAAIASTSLSSPASESALTRMHSDTVAMGYTGSSSSSSTNTG
jgi:hypothetical protein